LYNIVYGWDIIISLSFREREADRGIRLNRRCWIFLDKLEMTLMFRSQYCLCTCSL